MSQLEKSIEQYENQAGVKTYKEGLRENISMASPSIEENRIFCPGMHLRDWFAGQALASFNERNFKSWNEVAASAYAVADAMMKAREDNNEQGRR